MKKCFKCGVEKELSEFYKHSAMLDGHLNKCKECTKNDVHQNYKKNMKSPEWRAKEKERSKDKYHRLNYCQRSYELKKANPFINAEYKSMNKWLSKRIILKDTEQIHHWNYNLLKDVIVMDSDLHRIAHTVLKPIKIGQYMGLFTDVNGFVLVNKSDHLKYLLNHFRSLGIVNINIHCHDYSYYQKEIA